MRKQIKTKRYSVGVNEAQDALLHSLMEEDMVGDVSSYFGHMLLEIRRTRSENVKRGPGRPRNDTNGSNIPQDDLVERYCAPDYPRNGSFYSYEGLKDFYDFDPRNRGAMPPRDQLRIHPKYTGE